MASVASRSIGPGSDHPTKAAAAPEVRPEVLRIRGLTVSLPSGADRLHAVVDIDLDVRAGETVCIVGESGSGKSVTGFSVMGLLPAGLRVERGSIRLHDEELVGAGPARLRSLRGTSMAMIFQEPMTALNPTRTVGDQVGETFRLHRPGMSGAERRQRVLGLLDDVRLPDPEALVRAYPHQLSGGQRQRVLIASAMALEPALILADEPTTALDVTTQAQILSLLADLQRRHGTAVLFVTHDFGVVGQIADRIVVLRGGRLVEQGSRATVLGKPRDPYTRELLAAVPSLDPPAPRALPPGPDALQCRGLTKVFGTASFWQRQRTVRALDDVDLSLGRGETLGVVGESGSGKSTLARVIVRLTEADGGSIRLPGTSATDARDASPATPGREVQMIFQDPYRSLNPRMRIGASLIEGPLNQGVDEAEAWRLAESLLEAVGLGPTTLERYPHEFSGGQRQRICIARALAMRPRVLVADEAVSALDVTVQAQVLALLRELREDLQLSLLFITHDLRVAAQLCDRLVVMQRGRIVESGPTAAVLAAPTHPYTRELLASSPDWRAPRAAR